MKEYYKFYLPFEDHFWRSRVRIEGRKKFGWKSHRERCSEKYIGKKMFYFVKNKFQIKAGSHVAYFDKNGKMRDCTFLCAENQKEYRNLTPIDIIADMLCSEEEIWYFCNQNNIGDPDSHVYRLLEVKKIDSRS